MTVLMSALGERAQGEGGGAKETAERHPSGLSTGNDPFGQRPENFSIVTPTSADTHFESSRKLTNDESKVESAQPFDVHNPSCSHDDTLPSGEVYIQEAMDKLPKRCLLCRGIGTPSTCGSLVPVRVNGEEGAVHHACAVWAPQVYESEDALGVKTYNNLDSEWTRSQSQPCTACFALGAAVSCAQPGCQASYHLPCAVRSTDVILNKETFELWCPKHSILRSDDDQDMEVEGEEAFACSKRVQRKNSRPSKAAEDDEDFCPYRKPRRSTVSTTSRRHRFQRSVLSSLPPETSQVKVPATLSYATSTAADNRVQRPRTDWQRHGNVWVKVVPPWWAEHRTIHFASKHLCFFKTANSYLSSVLSHWSFKLASQMFFDR